VDQRVNALPATARKIARVLRALGIRGRRDNECACALACYLSAHLPPGYLITVREEHVEVRWRDQWGPPLHQRALPAAATAFITGFDAGRYPALEE
jgi:hypothetical protein